jgi:hypothetical protein
MVTMEPTPPPDKPARVIRLNNGEVRSVDGPESPYLGESRTIAEGAFVQGPRR